MTDRFQPKTLLVTGGAGFIGSNFIHGVLGANPSVRIVNLDVLTYAGSLDNLSGLPDPSRHRFVRGDIRDPTIVERVFRDEPIDAVVHFAAESHVDRSIDDATAFITTNVVGTWVLLDAARRAWSSASACRSDVRFLHVGTDEVYGSLDPGAPSSQEGDSYAPSSPYAASKAGSDHLVRSCFVTWGLPVLVTHCSNNYGPRQHEEKFIPTVIRSCGEQRPIPLYGDGRQVRDWLHVDDHCQALWRVLERGTVGSTYNIGGGVTLQNRALAERICAEFDRVRPSSGPHRALITSVTDRLGHDRRYAVNADRVGELGWAPHKDLAEGLEGLVVDWVRSHPET